MAVGTTQSSINAGERCGTLNTRTQGEPTYDAAVVGGGIVGLAAALAFANAGRRTVVVERAPPQRMRGALGFDARSVALTPASVRFLNDLADLDGVDFTPIEEMRVWERHGASRLRFRAEARLASVVESSVLVDALWRTAQSRLDTLTASVAGLAGLAVARRCASDRDGTVVLNVRDADGSERTIRARLVVAADGAESRVRDLAGVRTRHEPAPRLGEQRAIATVARTEKAHGHIAWQRFGDTGPVALLPLSVPNAVSVIWSASASESSRIEALDDAAFRAALGAETEHVLGRIEAVDRRFSFSAKQTLAADLNPHPRILLAGDAVRTLHPLAGQGVNIGLEDVCAIAAKASQRGVDDLGTPGVWRDYARNRRQRSKMMMALMRGLLAAYCGANAHGPWFRLVRNETLRQIDASGAAKRHLVREAMGLGAFAG